MVVGASGVAAGLGGGVAMGAVLAAVEPAFLLEMVPSLYDLQGGIAGWVAHFVHSALFGGIFALLTAKSPLRRFVSGIGRSTAFGVGWGLLLWVFAAGVVMPVWLDLTFFQETPLVPYLRPWILVAHLTYGASVGACVRLFLSIADGS